jgi:site-specific recombinase XerD
MIPWHDVSAGRTLTERQGAASDPLFPASTGRRLSRDVLERRLAKYVQIAASKPGRYQPPDALLGFLQGL